MLEINIPSRLILYWKRQRDAKDCALCYNISQTLSLRVVSILNLALVLAHLRVFDNTKVVPMVVEGGHTATKKQRLMPRLN